MVNFLKKYFSQPFFIAALLCLILFYSGIVKVKDRNAYYSLISRQKICHMNGIIDSTPSLSTDGSVYSTSIKVTSVNTKLKLSDENNFSAQGILKVQFPSEQIQSFMPGKLFSLSEGNILLEKGAQISCRGKWSDSMNVFQITDIDSCYYKKTLKGKFDYIRALCRLFFKRLMYSWGSAGALILSLLSGSRDYLSENIRQNFKNAGLSHILALSGMHLSFFSGIASSAGKKFLSRKYLFFVQVIFVLAFVWFAGISPSLFRALLCSLFMLAASKANCKNIDALTVLCCVFLIHIVIYPQNMSEAAFMLSYGALAGILTVTELIKRKFYPVFTPSVAESLTASIGAQTFTFPVSIRLFGEIMPVGIAASVIVSPLVTFFLTFSLICIIICAVFPFMVPVAGRLLNILYGIIDFSVGVFAKCPTIKLL